MTDKACKICRRLISGNSCPACKTEDLTKSYKGVIIVLDSTSEIAKEAGITVPGTYAVKVK